MIKVENLTKRYAGQPAIENLDFEVGKGEIMGFLGPNGAGKTTTMRILASFMPPTSGRAIVAGFDVFEQSLQARAHLGFMPEHVPLYADAGRTSITVRRSKGCHIAASRNVLVM
jgi:ABC-2 type transport system ATP-binding protein